jgi:regulator of sigma E protease
VHDREVVVSSNGRAIVSWNALRSDILYDALTQQPLPLLVQGADGHQRPVLINLQSARLDPRYLLKDIGLTAYQPPIPPILGEVVQDSAAEHAGLKSGDRIVAIDAVPVESFQQVRSYVAARPGQHVNVDVRRGDESLKVDVVLESRIVDGSVVGRLGASNQRVANAEELWHDLYLVERLGPVDAISEAVRQTGRETVVVTELMFHMLLGDISVKNLSGPISTAEAAGFAASIGLSTFLYFIAFVSLNVGIFNLFPVPILDGGQIVNCLIEAVKGSPLSERAMVVVQQIGLALLILIMGFAFYNDITRTFG